MPLDPSIYGLIQQPKIQGPMETFGQAMTIRGLIDQGDLARMQREQMQRSMDSEARFRSLFEGGTPSDDQLMAADPTRGGAFIKNRRENEKLEADTAAKRASTMRDKLEIFRSALQPVNDQASFDAWRANLVRDIPVLDSTVPREFSQEGKLVLLRKGDEAVKSLTPDIRPVDIGGKIVMMDMNPNTNPAIKGSQFDKTMSPGDSARLGELQASNQYQERIAAAKLYDDTGVRVAPRNVSIGVPNVPVPGAPQVPTARGAAPVAPQAAPVAPQPAPVAPQPASEPGLSPKQARERAAKLSEERPKDLKSLRSVLPAVQAMRDEAEAIKNDPNLWAATGFLGNLRVPFTDWKPAQTPGTPGASVNARIDSLKARTFASVITALREASKTGGLVGNMSDREGARFEAMVASLDQAQKPEDFRDRLQQIINYTHELEKQMLDGYADTYKERPNIPRSNIVVDRNKQGGQVVGGQIRAPGAPAGSGIRFLGFE